VLNDEAHHCYMDKPITPRLGGGRRAGDTDDKQRNEDARVWFKGIRAIAEHVGVKAVYDLSATPFYLGGSGYKEGFIFPWTVSDFSLMDAIESGIVKAPRIPVDDDTDVDTVTYRSLWELVGNDLPKRARAKTDVTNWVMPAELEAALHSLYRSYERAYRPLAEGPRATRRATAGLHRRLPQHGGLQARPRLDRRHRDRTRRRDPAPRPWQPAAVRQRRRRGHQPPQAPHDPRRLRPARVRRSDEGTSRRPPPPRSRPSRPSSASATPARTPTPSPTRTCCAR
jgi:hypothetical protein